MKYAHVAAIAAISGALAGFATSMLMMRMKPDSLPGKVTAKEFVLLDERDKPAARLMYGGEGPVLRFYDRDSSVALEMSAGEGNRGLVFLGKEGQTLATLGAVSNGDAALSLGGVRGTRVLLGAFHSDEITDKPSREWGLQFRGDVIATCVQPGCKISGGFVAGCCRDERQTGER